MTVVTMRTRDKTKGDGVWRRTCKEKAQENKCECKDELKVEVGALLSRQDGSKETWDSSWWRERPSLPELDL